MASAALLPPALRLALSHSPHLAPLSTPLPPCLPPAPAPPPVPSPDRPLLPPRAAGARREGDPLHPQLRRCHQQARMVGAAAPRRAVLLLLLRRRRRRVSPRKSSCRPAHASFSPLPGSTAAKLQSNLLAGCPRPTPRARCPLSRTSPAASSSQTLTPSQVRVRVVLHCRGVTLHCGGPRLLLHCGANSTHTAISGKGGREGLAQGPAPLPALLSAAHIACTAACPLYRRLCGGQVCRGGGGGRAAQVAEESGRLPPAVSTSVLRRRRRRSSR